MPTTSCMKTIVYENHMEAVKSLNTCPSPYAKARRASTGRRRFSRRPPSSAGDRASSSLGNRSYSQPTFSGCHRWSAFAGIITLRRYVTALQTTRRSIRTGRKKRFRFTFDTRHASCRRKRPVRSVYRVPPATRSPPNIFPDAQLLLIFKYRGVENSRDKKTKKQQNTLREKRSRSKRARAPLGRRIYTTVCCTRAAPGRVSFRTEARAILGGQRTVV